MQCFFPCLCFCFVFLPCLIFCLCLCLFVLPCHCFCFFRVRPWQILLLLLISVLIRGKCLFLIPSLTHPALKDMLLLFSLNLFLYRFTVTHMMNGLALRYKFSLKIGKVAIHQRIWAIFTPGFAD